MKKYIIYLKKEFNYEKGKLEKGYLLYSQDESFTIEQIEEAKKQGIAYSWGFGPCYNMVPFEYLQFAEIKNFDI